MICEPRVYRLSGERKGEAPFFPLTLGFAIPLSLRARPPMPAFDVSPSKPPFPQAYGRAGSRLSLLSAMLRVTRVRRKANPLPAYGIPVVSYARAHAGRCRRSCRTRVRSPSCRSRRHRIAGESRSRGRRKASCSNHLFAYDVSALRPSHPRPYIRARPRY